MKTKKPLCEYSKRGFEMILQCTLDNNQGCKFVRYCTQDSTWWNSNNFISCERRRQEMSKKNKNKFYFDDVNVETTTDEIIDIVQDVENIDNVEDIDVMEFEEDTKPLEDIKSEENKVEEIVTSSPIRRSSRRRIIY